MDLNQNLSPSNDGPSKDGVGNKQSVDCASASSSCPIQAAVKTAAAIASSTSAVNHETHNASYESSRPSVDLSYHPHPQASGPGLSHPEHRPISEGGSFVPSPSSTSIYSHETQVGPPQQTTSSPALCVPAFQAAATPLVLSTCHYPAQPMADKQHHAPIISTNSNALLSSASAVPLQPTSSAIHTAPTPHFATCINNEPWKQASQSACMGTGMMVLPGPPMTNGMQAQAVFPGQPMRLPILQQQQLQLLHPPVPHRPNVTPSPPMPSVPMLKRRSGKWTVEEEDYAEILIELFEKGQVVDEKNGVTLRSFLSRKLFCAPMRISKKYAGKGIGKKVFISKVNPAFSSNPYPPGFYQNIARMKEAEIKFLRVAFPDLGTLLYPLIAGSYINRTATVFVSNGSVPPPPMSIAPSTTQGISQKPDMQKLESQNDPPAHVRQEDAIAQGMSAPLPSVHRVVTSTSKQSSTTAHYVENTTELEHCTQMIPASSAVLPENEAEDSGRTASNSNVDAAGPEMRLDTSACQDDSAKKKEQVCLLPVTSRNDLMNQTQKERNHVVAVSAIQRLHEAYVNSVLNKATKIDTGKRREEGGKAQEVKNSQFEIKSPTKNQGGIPDLLSGFDKVAGPKGEEQHMIGDFDPYSPTYTTQSFDELHQFLGKNLTPLASVTSSHGPTTTSQNVVHKPVIPRIKTSSMREKKPRLPNSGLRMRPSKRKNPFDTSREELDSILETNDLSLASGDFGLGSKSGFGDSLAKDTSQTPNRNSVTSGVHHNENIAGREHSAVNCQDFALKKGAFVVDGYARSNSFSPFNNSRSAPAAISDPSDFASDDLNSGNENSIFADSDETHSETSTHRSKKTKSGSEGEDDDDDDVRSWYKTLVHDPQD